MTGVGAYPGVRYALLLLVGCHWGVTCPDLPWRELTVGKNLVLATRPGCGFPDADVEYRLYRVGQPWAVVDQGVVEAKHMDPRFVPVSLGELRASMNGLCAIAEDRLHCSANMNSH